MVRLACLLIARRLQKVQKTCSEATMPDLTRSRAFCLISQGYMPTYEYVCEKCGHSFEKFQSIAAESLTSCPEDICPQKRWGKGKVKRAISGGAGLIFKGTGFYITDYRSDKYKEAAKKDSHSASSSSSDKKSDSGAKPAAPKGDSKPAAKAAS
jgi:putative FmdB family regulatory protein